MMRWSIAWPSGNTGRGFRDQSAMVAARRFCKASGEFANARRHDARRPPILRDPGLRRSRDPGAPGEPRPRAASQGVRDHVGRTGCGQTAAFPAYLARIRHEEAAGGGGAATFPTRPCLPQRRTQQYASSRIRTARMVSRRRELLRPDERLRGAIAAHAGCRRSHIFYVQRAAGRSRPKLGAADRR